MLSLLHTSLLALSLVMAVVDELVRMFADHVLLGLGIEAAAGTAGVLALLALLAGKSKPKKKKKKVDDGPTSNCPPLPALAQAEVLALVEQGKAEGVVGLMAFVSYVARLMYPTRSDGTAIPWPTKAPFVLPANLDGSLICRWDEIKRMISEIDPPVPEPETPTIADVITDLLLPYPLPGRFYAIKKGDSLDQIARQALNNRLPGAGNKNANRMAYIKNCINLSKKWNLPLYGSTSSSNLFPKAYFTNGQGLRMAFFPYHAPALQFVLGGKIPPRQITPSGARIQGGNAYGILWLPPVDDDALTQFDQVVCAGKWDDGSPTSEPPPLFFQLVTES